MTCNVDYLLPVIQWKCLFCLHHCKISITIITYDYYLSIIVTVRAGVKSTKVVCPHDGTYDLRILAIFSKTGFVDIIPLCWKLSNYTSSLLQNNRSQPQLTKHVGIPQTITNLMVCCRVIVYSEKSCSSYCYFDSNINAANTRLTVGWASGQMS